MSKATSTILITGPHHHTERVSTQSDTILSALSRPPGTPTIQATNTSESPSPSLSSTLKATIQATDTFKSPSPSLSGIPKATTGIQATNNPSAVSLPGTPPTIQATSTSSAFSLPGTTLSKVLNSSDSSESSSPPTATNTVTSLSPESAAGDPSPNWSTGPKSTGPIIGGVIGGIVFVALSALTAVIIIKRRRRKQSAPIPTINPLLDNSHVTELAAQRDLSSKRPPWRRLQGVITGGTSTVSLNQNQNQDQDQVQNQTMPAGPGPTIHSAVQRQVLEIMEIMSERIAALVLEGHQRGHDEDTNSQPPPDYESRASV